MTNFVRFQNNGSASFGVLKGETISEISNAPFDSYQTTGNTFSLADEDLQSDQGHTHILLPVGEQKCTSKLRETFCGNYDPGNRH